MKWYKTSGKKPDSNREVLCLFPEGCIHVCRFNEDSKNSFEPSECYDHRIYNGTLYQSPAREYPKYWAEKPTQEEILKSLNENEQR